ncbi:MAG TPA: acetyl-CoA synthetase [Dehalococcoidia bacterium]|nr:acetyl-CoA synthetase [Dehalococcoidia bacterium]
MIAPISMNPIIEQARSENRLFLTEIESKTLLGQAGVNCNLTELATTASEAISLSERLGYPVALKIASPDIIHKNDGGGVILALDTPEKVENAYREILENIHQQKPQAKIHGISVQKMAPPGVPVIIGMSKDPQFGPVIMFGLGGLLVEIIEDISLRISPLTRKDAAEMIREVKGYKLLTGYRGQPPANLPALEDMLMAVSDFAEQTNVVKEIDLNPVIAASNDAVAVDATVVFEESILE